MEKQEREFCACSTYARYIDIINIKYDLSQKDLFVKARERLGVSSEVILIHRDFCDIAYVCSSLCPRWHTALCWRFDTYISEKHRISRPTLTMRDTTVRGYDTTQSRAYAAAVERTLPIETDFKYLPCRVVLREGAEQAHARMFSFSSPAARESPKRAEDGRETIKCRGCARETAEGTILVLVSLFCQHGGEHEGRAHPQCTRATGVTCAMGRR